MIRFFSAQDTRQGRQRPNMLVVLVVSLILFAVGWGLLELVF